MIADYENFPILEEYLGALAEGKISTCHFDPVDTSPGRRLTSGPLKMEIGNPFHRPITSGNQFPVVPGSYMDMDGQRL